MFLFSGCLKPNSALLVTLHCARPRKSSLPTCSASAERVGQGQVRQGQVRPGQVGQGEVGQGEVGQGQVGQREVGGTGAGGTGAGGTGADGGDKDRWDRGEVGGITCRVLCTWWLLSLAVKGPWLGPSGPLLTLAAWISLENTTLDL